MLHEFCARAMRHGSPSMMRVGGVGVATDTATRRRVSLHGVGAEAWPYCHALACSNMTPYLERRGQRWNASAWLARAALQRILLVMADNRRVGFAAQRDDIDDRSLHLAELQLEPEARGQGIGGACLELIVDQARQRGLHGVKLHVFRDNPARRLYERHGFRPIDRGFDKLTLWRPLERTLNLEGQRS